MLTNNVDEELQGELEALALYTPKNRVRFIQTVTKLRKQELNLNRTKNLTFTNLFC